MHGSRGLSTSHTSKHGALGESIVRVVVLGNLNRYSSASVDMQAGIADMHTPKLLVALKTLVLLVWIANIKTYKKSQLLLPCRHGKDVPLCCQD